MKVTVNIPQPLPPEIKKCLASRMEKGIIYQLSDTNRGDSRYIRTNGDRPTIIGFHPTVGVFHFDGGDDFNYYVIAKEQFIDINFK